MKNLVLLRSPSEVTSYVRGLIRTAIIRESPYVARWIESFAQWPAVFAEMSDDHIEYPHFATWFGMTYLREYQDPVISDLYLLHEIVHAVLNRYDEKQLFTAWYRKTSGVEFAASLETEGHIYLEIPGLRERSFPDQIWADRFIGAEKRLGGDLRDIMRQNRLRAMTAPDPMDYCEQAIAAYARQNFEWANIWNLPVAGCPAYVMVEQHMARFRTGAISLDEHVDWLMQCARGGEGRSTDVPFHLQAKLFAPVYWSGKLSYRVINPAL